MVFNSATYAVFFPVVLGLYWLLRHRGQNRLLLVASYAFYAAFDWRFVGLLALSTGLDFWFGHAVDAAPDGKRKRWLLASVAVNLGILGAFKYFNFFIDSGNDLLRRLGFDSTSPVLRVVLPVGISFYTFHGISYVFDVYRRVIRPTRHLVDYACFVAYFPQLVAGPIGRATMQLPQFERARQRPDADAVRSALLLILVGLVKKVVIADGVAHVANQAYGAPASWSSAYLLLATLAFSLQIYGDFSGYSDIARGSSRLLGIELPLNFAEPYLSRDITEFWRRWHISLSNWLRDYLYVPLGGNRGTPRATYRNLLVTMVLGGLWHGAAWTFVAWGAGHGLALAAHRWWRSRRPLALNEDGRLEPGWVRRFGAPVATFALVTLLWVPFRAPDFATARTFLGGIVDFRGGPFNLDDVVVVAFAFAATFAIDLVQRRARVHGVESLLPRLPVLRPVAVGAAVLALVVWSGGTPVQFLYFQF